DREAHGVHDQADRPDRGVCRLRPRVRAGEGGCEGMSEHETSTSTSTESPTVFVRAGSGGWGPGLTLRVDGSRTKVISVTGGGIHPVAQKIADLIGAEAVDGFATSVPDDAVDAAVIYCGGTARIGVTTHKGYHTGVD